MMTTLKPKKKKKIELLTCKDCNGNGYLSMERNHHESLPLCTACKGNGYLMLKGFTDDGILAYLFNAIQEVIRGSKTTKH